jgi:hypothetical protein
MAGEQAGGVAAFSDPQTLLSFTLNLSSPPRLGERLWRVALVDALKASGFFARDKAFYLSAMATNVATAELPFPGRVQGGPQAAALIPPNRLYLFSHLLLPALSKAFLRDADACGRLRAAQAALAIERFRLAHTNALPQSLEQLVPAYLHSVPADPYDGHPLRFKARKAGYVVYSIGRDGKDDGGLEFKLMNASGPHDLTFILDK